MFLLQNVWVVIILMITYNVCCDNFNDYLQRDIGKQCRPDQVPDQMALSAASDLGLHCLPVSLLWDARHE